jgi:hypothetical protein
LAVVDILQVHVVLAYRSFVDDDLVENLEAPSWLQVDEDWDILELLPGASAHYDEHIVGLVLMDTSELDSTGSCMAQKMAD